MKSKKSSLGHFFNGKLKAHLSEMHGCGGMHLYPTLRYAYVGLLREHLSEMQAQFVPFAVPYVGLLRGPASGR